MINYTSFILQNMKAIRPTTTKELCSQSITILKMHEKVLSSIIIKIIVSKCRYIWSTTHHDQSSCQIWKLSDQQTKSNYVQNALDQRLNRSIHMMKSTSPITPAKIIESKCQDNMINYTSWLIILPDRRAIIPMTSEELHSQSEVGRTHEQRKERTHRHIPP